MPTRNNWCIYGYWSESLYRIMSRHLAVVELFQCEYQATLFATGSFWIFHRDLFFPDDMCNPRGNHVAPGIFSVWLDLATCYFSPPESVQDALKPWGNLSSRNLFQCRGADIRQTTIPEVAQIFVLICNMIYLQWHKCLSILAGRPI